MTITTLSAHKGNTWKIELDDSGELFFLHVSVVQRCGLRKGMTLTPQQWEQVQTAELSRKAYQYACFLLDNRGYSYQEMFRKLEPKYPQAVWFRHGGSPGEIPGRSTTVPMRNSWRIITLP